MAPRTGAASARAAATCLLLDLSHDEVSIVTHELCDPLQPLLAVHLSSTAKGLREAMEEQLAELKQQTQQAAALAALCGWSCAQLRATTDLYLGAFYSRPLTLAHWRTLGTLARCGSLPALQGLFVIGSDNGDEGVASLADGLRLRSTSARPTSLVLKARSSRLRSSISVTTTRSPTLAAPRSPPPCAAGRCRR